MVKIASPTEIPLKMAVEDLFSFKFLSKKYAVIIIKNDTVTSFWVEDDCKITIGMVPATKKLKY
ncbi:hypothetical protein GCM10011514_12060 [Emticicia aquatilis]|uniref:Uncharacterized protein n=1 Tax=Emticicia aquatilis TaxID=1537369 RepID=A0A916YKC6_9BACT|nr:hypothetical protein GCM10011514_12060 [Emticicia aquatilis]